MREEGSRGAGGCIVLEKVSAPNFEKLLEYLYAHRLPKGEEWKAGSGPGEMMVVTSLYAHCVAQFGVGVKVRNVVVLLMQAHDSGLAELEVSKKYLTVNVLAVQVLLRVPQVHAVSTVDVFCTATDAQRLMWM